MPMHPVHPRLALTCAPFVLALNRPGKIHITADSCRKELVKVLGGREAYDAMLRAVPPSPKY